MSGIIKILSISCISFCTLSGNLQWGISFTRKEKHNFFVICAFSASFSWTPSNNCRNAYKKFSFLFPSVALLNLDINCNSSLHYKVPTNEHFSWYILDTGKKKKDREKGPFLPFVSFTALHVCAWFVFPLTLQCTSVTTCSWQIENIQVAWYLETCQMLFKAIKNTSYKSLVYCYRGNPV